MIEGTPGGCQDWFKDFWMNLGGCGALAACDISICLSKNMQYHDCCPYNPLSMTKAQYVDFGMKMKPYIHPRMGGVSKTSLFTDGYGKYLRDCGYQAEFMTCPGESSYADACRFVKESLDRNLPIAYLMLHHRDQKFKDLNWHWFMITGYTIKNERMFLTYHTYGEVHSVDFEDLWNTGIRRKGGMVSLRKLYKLQQEEAGL